MKNDPENKPVHQPHDKLVKRLLSNPEAVKDILSLYLPKDVLDIVDLNYLEMQKDSLSMMNIVRMQLMFSIRQDFKMKKDIYGVL